jgi:hypothetical protein
LGQCKLCLRDPIELRRSHLLPAGVFRLVYSRPTSSNSNPNPWVLSPNRSPFQTSKQSWAHLLCGDCEHLFNRRGETWVLRNCLQRDGSFPLLTALNRRMPLAADPAKTTTRIYSAAEIPEVNIDAITYFATSMFWRASVYPWTSEGTVPVKLGKYGDQFRMYLLDLGPFPENTRLHVAVREPGQMSALAHEPAGGRSNGVHMHRFPIPGFAFSVVVGKQAASVFDTYCFVRGEGNPLAVTAQMESMLFDQAKAAFALGRQAK